MREAGVMDAFRAWIRDQLRTYDASHDAVHALNVERLATRIAADAALSDVARADVPYAALAHDLCDRKYCAPDDVADRLAALNGALASVEVDAEVARVVRCVVPLVSFTRLARDGVPSELDEDADARAAYHAVSDADMLEAMGLTGMLRTHMLQAVRGSTTADAHAYVRTRLLTYLPHLHYAWARKEGARRHALMSRLCFQYERERDPM